MHVSIFEETAPNYVEEWKQSVKNLVSSRKFESTIIFFILVSSVLLAVESPLDDPESNKVKTIKIIDIIITSVFILEVILKVFAFGLICNGPKSYLRQSANILDFLIVVFSVRNP